MVMMVRLLAVPFVFALAFAATSSPANADADAAPAEITPALAQRIDAAVRATTGSTKGLAPGVSVAIVENGKLVYARAFGVADIATKTPATPQTRFRIASVTKMFTAVAVMQQVEKGTVRLDEPLATYLPDAPHAKEVTIRQLLMHTSGIWNYGDESFSSGRVVMPTTPQAIVASVGSRPLEAPPGSKFVYSNTGYVLLGLVVEAVTHQPLARYLQTNVLVPAGMTETTFGELPAGVPVAVGYMDAGGAPALPYSPSWFYADGDMVSTASDVARFDAALMDGRLVKPETFASMQSSSILAPLLGATVRYGLGLMLSPNRDVMLVGHHGGIPGYVAEVQMLPAQRFAVVVLADASEFPTSTVKGAVLQLVVPALFAGPSGPAAAGEDLAVTAKLWTLVEGIQRGTVDRATLTDRMSAALTPESLSGAATQFASLGALQTLTYRGKETANGFDVYHYTAAFAAGQSLPVTFSVEPKTGKIGGLFFA